MNSKVQVYVYFSEYDSKLFVVRSYPKSLETEGVYVEKELEYCESCRNAVISFIKNIKSSNDDGLYVLNLKQADFVDFKSGLRLGKRMLDYGDCEFLDIRDSAVKDCYKKITTKKTAGLISFHYLLWVKKIKLVIIPEFLEYMYTNSSTLRWLFT